MHAPPRVAVLGGCGHVGLPLALTFAERGCPVTIVDTNADAVARVQRGEVGFLERGAEELLRAQIGKGLRATTDNAVIAEADVVVCVIGTPIDEHLNPQVGKLLHLVDTLRPHLRAGQLFVLRSTVYPGATLRLARWFEDHVPGVDVAFCPERVAQGFAIEEIHKLPQIVSGVTPRAAARAEALFAMVAPKIVRLEPTEAELGKLFCNAWRYVSFAVANQFYALCAQNGVDYARVHAGIVDGYPRMRGLPTAGFAAGPCLFKDTMQLAAYYDNAFSLGQSAMLVNEGFPRNLMSQLRTLDLRRKKVGLLGMAFKGDNDDTRESLAFKMRKLLELECEAVLCTDPYVREGWLLPLERVLSEADALVICAPHTQYRGLAPRQPTLDPFNILGRGGLLA
ncbi:MAG TPA: nucleotide sugar dehydrogenase [Anaeromyxobacteraceae bacterium]|nr:nucleotide sugar dehydrogenase [Anaeromyxobacteraceae bacterium]